MLESLKILKYAMDTKQFFLLGPKRLPSSSDSMYRKCTFNVGNYVKKIEGVYTQRLYLSVRSLALA